MARVVTWPPSIVWSHGLAMGASYSQYGHADAGARAAAVAKLTETELAPSSEARCFYDALLRAPSWDELLEEFSGDDVRALRDTHPRNLAYLLCHATAALENECALDTASTRDANLAAGAARLLGRLLPFAVGDMYASGAPAGGLEEVSTFLAGLQSLPLARVYDEPDAPAPAAEAAPGQPEAEAGSEVLLAPSGEAVPSDRTAPEGAAPGTQAEQTEALPGPPLYCRIASALLDALLCPGVTLAPRSRAWAPPLAPGTPSPPPDAELAAHRLDFLRVLTLVCGAEALSPPFVLDSEQSSATAASPPRFLAAFSGRTDEFSQLCPGTAAQRTRLLTSLVNGASCAPALMEEAPQLVLSCMRALMLLVCVAEHDVPGPPRPDDMSSQFAELGPPQAASLHASAASLLAQAASQAVGAADWAGTLAETVGGDPSLSRVVAHPVPAGAEEALALALAATERMPTFAAVSIGFSGQGGWMLACPTLALMASFRDDPTASSLLRAGSFLLLSMSTNRQFALALNEPLRPPDATLCLATGMGPIIPPGASRGDALLAALAAMLAYPLSGGASIRPQAKALYPPLLAVFRNVAPYVKSLTPVGAGGAIHLLASLAQPSVLLADQGGSDLLSTVLDSLVAVVEHQGESNAALLAALLRHSSLLTDLASMALGAPITDALALLSSRLDGIAPALAAWRSAHPAADIYAEAAYLSTQTLVGMQATRAAPPLSKPSTYARTRAVLAWQARHAVSLVLLSDPRAVDGPRIRRLKVTVRAAAPSGGTEDT